MDLKELLGEELYNQVIEKAGENKIAIVSDGNWFPKEKFNEVNNTNKDLKQQLKDRDTQLEELKKVDAAGLQQKIQDLQQANEKATKDYEAKLSQQAFDFALEKAIASAKARNPRAVKALLNVDSIKLDGETLLGLDDQLKNLKESDAYLFDEGEPAGLKGRQPHPSNPNNPTPQKNPWKPGEINLTEQGRILRDDPELAKTLMAQAKK